MTDLSAVVRKNDHSTPRDESALFCYAVIVQHQEIGK